MGVYKVPVFEKGSVLTHDMLNSLKDYGIGFNEMMYHDYSDGIISGFQIIAMDQMLQIEPGIFLFQKEIYVIDKPVKVVYSPTNSVQMVVINIGQKGYEKNYTIQDVEICIRQGIDIKENEIEIARFNMQSGAMLRTAYRNFQDTNTQFDTLNLLHAKWAGYRRETISPVILDYYVRDLTKSNMQNEVDYNFAQTILCANGKTFNRAAIELYISKRLQRPFVSLSNEQIYSAFCEILTNCPSDTVTRPSRMRENRRIIVD